MESERESLLLEWCVDICDVCELMCKDQVFLLLVGPCERCAKEKRKKNKWKDDEREQTCNKSKLPDCPFSKHRDSPASLNSNAAFPRYVLSNKHVIKTISSNKKPQLNHQCICRDGPCTIDTRSWDSWREGRKGLFSINLNKELLQWIRTTLPHPTSNKQDDTSRGVWIHQREKNK